MVFCTHVTSRNKRNYFHAPPPPPAPSGGGGGSLADQIAAAKLKKASKVRILSFWK